MPCPKRNAKNDIRLFEVAPNITEIKNATVPQRSHGETIPAKSFFKSSHHFCRLKKNPEQNKNIGTPKIPIAAPIRCKISSDNDKL